MKVNEQYVGCSAETVGIALLFRTFSQSLRFRTPLCTLDEHAPSWLDY